MSNRKRSGTATATKSPPSKKIRDRGQAADAGGEASGSRKTAAKEPKKSSRKEGARAERGETGGTLEEDGFEIMESESETKTEERKGKKKQRKARAREVMTAEEELGMWPCSAHGTAR